MVTALLLTSTSTVVIPYCLVSLHSCHKSQNSYWSGLAFSDAHIGSTRTGCIDKLNSPMQWMLRGYSHLPACQCKINMSYYCVGIVTFCMLLSFVALFLLIYLTRTDGHIGKPCPGFRISCSEHDMRSTCLARGWSPRRLPESRLLPQKISSCASPTVLLSLGFWPWVFSSIHRITYCRQFYLPCW